jgi:hypothetical protein
LHNTENNAVYLAVLILVSIVPSLKDDILGTFRKISGCLIWTMS